jgi:hypothetical protein
MVRADIGAWFPTLVIGSWLALGLLYVAGGVLRSRTRTADTTGIVVRLEIQGWNPMVRRPDVAFVDRDGIRREFTSANGTGWNEWPVGSHVKVTYDPNDPTNAELAFWEAKRTVVAVLAAVGVSLVALGIVVVMRTRFP